MQVYAKELNQGIIKISCKGTVEDTIGMFKTKKLLSTAE